MSLDPIPGVDPEIWREFVLRDGRIRKPADVDALRVGLAGVLCPQMVKNARRRKFDNIESVQKIAIECNRSLRDVFVSIYEFLSVQDDLDYISKQVAHIDRHLYYWCVAQMLRQLYPRFPEVDQDLVSDAVSLMKRASSLRQFSGNKKQYQKEFLSVERQRRDAFVAHCRGIDSLAPNVRFSVCIDIITRFGKTPSSDLDSFVSYGLGISSSRSNASSMLRTNFANGERQEFQPNPKLFDEVRGAFLSGLLSYPEEWVSSGSAIGARPSGLASGLLGAAAGAAAVALLRR